MKSIRVNDRSAPFIYLRTTLVFIACLSLWSCQKPGDPETEISPIDSNVNPPANSASVLSLHSLFRRWTLVTINGSPAVVEDDGETEAWIELGPPCYEKDDGHCNDAFDGGWEPSEQRTGRLSLQGYSGCNWFGGEAILEDGRLVAKPVISTERGCGSAEAQEAKIRDLLSEKPFLFMRDDTLEISDETGNRIDAILSFP